MVLFSLEEAIKRRRRRSTTDTGALLWRLGNNQSFFDSTHTVGEIKKLEYFDTQFNTSLGSVEGMNYYTSTATIVSSLPNNITNITIMCDDNGDAIGGESAVLTLLGRHVCKTFVLFTLYIHYNL